MKSWGTVAIPTLASDVKVLPLYLTNSRSSLKELVSKKPSYRMYVCGITPYDATHLGHASTKKAKMERRFLMICLKQSWVIRQNMLKT